MQDLSSWQRYFDHGREIGKATAFIPPERFEQLLVAGMGGSAIVGHILSSLLKALQSKLSCTVHQDITYPHVPRADLSLIISYSGDTWETIKLFELLCNQGVRPVVIAHGGALKQRAQDEELPFIQIPQMLTPRSSLPVIFGIVASILERCNLPQFSAHDLSLMIGQSLAFYQELDYSDWISFASSYKLMHVWGLTGDAEGAVYRAVTQLNENAKMLTAQAYIPELVHNLIVGFEHGGDDQAVLLLKTSHIPDSLNKTVAILLDLMAENGVRVYKPEIFGDTFVHQLLSIVIWADFASVHLGDFRGVNIRQVRIIEALKERLKAHSFR